MSDVLHGAIGPEAGYDLKLEDGKLKVSVQQDGEIGGAKIELYLNEKAVLDAIAKKYPVLAGPIAGLEMFIAAKG